MIKILEPHIDRGEYETWKLRKLLKLFLSQEGDLPVMLCEFYELYCEGFDFLDNLGLGYGLTIQVLPNGYSSEYWQDLTDQEKRSILNTILPKAIDEAQKVLMGLDEGKIVITNKQDELGRYLCIDKRTEEEKDSNWESVRDSLSNPNSNPWWKFW